MLGNFFLHSNEEAGMGDNRPL